MKKKKIWLDFRVMSSSQMSLIVSKSSRRWQIWWRHCHSLLRLLWRVSFGYPGTPPFSFLPKATSKKQQGYRRTHSNEYIRRRWGENFSPHLFTNQIKGILSSSPWHSLGAARRKGCLESCDLYIFFFRLSSCYCCCCYCWRSFSEKFTNLGPFSSVNMS